jgi:hypothetical protein
MFSVRICKECIDKKQTNLREIHKEVKPITNATNRSNNLNRAVAMYAELMMPHSHIIALHVSIKCILYSTTDLVPALGQADLDILDEVYREGLSELINVLAVDLLWFALALSQPSG